MSYNKNYDIGSVRLDAPYSHFIYELPLLSFGDVMHTVGVSLVFNSRLVGQNPFYMSNGHKLSLQKRLIIQGGVPGIYENGDGSRVNLIQQSGNRYTFDDDSQRIIRGTGQAYILENPDYSTETYTTLGRITSVADKYGNTLLTYSYDESQSDKLLSVTYRDNKVINLEYNNFGVISAIQYVCDNTLICTSTLAYPGSSHAIVTHYSGVKYYTSYSGNVFTAYSANGSTYTDYSHKIICTKGTDSLEFERFIGAKTVDKTTFGFLGVNSESKFSIVEITDFQNVKTRTQYKDNKPIYTYEVGESEPLFHEDKYVGNIQMYSIDNATKNGSLSILQTVNQGSDMTYTTGSFRQGWMLNNLPTDGNTYIYFLSGWIKISDEFTDDKIYFKISQAINGNIEKIIEVNKPPVGQWVFFNIAFVHDSSTVCAFVEQPTSAIVTKDFRIIRDVLETYDSESKGYFRSSSNVLIIGDSTIVHLRDVTFPNCVYDEETDTVWYEDILKYKINQKLGIHQNEFYFNKCQKVISIASPEALTVQYGDAVYLLSECYLGKQNYTSRNMITTRFRDDVSSSVGSFIAETLNSSGQVISSQLYDEHLNVISSVNEGIETKYTRNSMGLVTSQSVGKVNESSIISTYASYDSGNTKLLSTTDEFGVVTSYTTNSVWGVVTKTTLNGETSVTDTFDDDMSDILSRTFAKANGDSKTHTFSYFDDYPNKLGITNGIVATQDESGYTPEGICDYCFTYSDGSLASVSKYGTTVESHQLSENGKTLTSSYPSSDNAAYTVEQKNDKYGRLSEITGQIVNLYRIDPEFDSETASYYYKDLDNGSSKLAQSTDLVTGKVIKYAYDNDRVTNIGTFNSSGTRIGLQVFDYDKAGRVTRNYCTYDKLNEKRGGALITYVKSDTDPLVDGRVNSYTYYVGEEEKACTTNMYDDYKRLTRKTVDLSSTSPFIKFFDYDKSRLRSAADTFSGTVLGTDSYTYDVNGRITSHCFVSDYGNHNKSYVYDDFGRLIRENNQTLDKTFIYEYNGIGNVTAVKSYGYTLGGVSGTPTTTTFSYNNDKLTSFNGSAITYNANGGVASYDGATYTWVKGKLSTIKQSLGSSARIPNLPSLQPSKTYSFTYNALGQRIGADYTYFLGNNTLVPIGQGEVIASSKTYFYDNAGKLLSETITDTLYDAGTASSEIIYLYDENSMIGMQYTSGLNVTNVYYYGRNPQGDVVAIYDTSGNKVVEYAYDAWGNCTIKSTTTNYTVAHANPIRYRGYYYDERTGLYYLNSRYYNPQWCRFISPDNTAYLDPETPNGLNLYAYCNNDPVNYVDPSGHAVSILIPLLILGGLALIGAGSGAAISRYIQFNSKEDFSFEEDFSVSHLILSTISGAAIGIMAGGLILSTIGLVGGAAALAAGKMIADVTILKAGIDQLIALGILAYDIGAIIATTTTGTVFELIEWISKYNIGQPLINPKKR